MQKLMCCVWDDITRLPLDCIETKVHFVESKEFDTLSCDLACIFVLPVAVVYFDCCKECVVVTCI
jgi:hypothetical protein